MLARDSLHFVLHFVNINTGIFSRLRVVAVTALLVEGRKRISKVWKV